MGQDAARHPVTALWARLWSIQCFVARETRTGPTADYNELSASVRGLFAEHAGLGCGGLLVPSENPSPRIHKLLLSSEKRRCA